MVNLEDWKKELKNHKKLIFVSLIFFLFTVIINYIAGDYVTEVTGVVAPDLIIDHIPTLNLSIIYVYLQILVIATLFIYPLIFRVKELHRVISQFSLLILVRAIFVCFTHLQSPSLITSSPFPWPLSIMDFKNDLFFSGHTAISFLGFLIFKDTKVRWAFLVASIVMAITVLLMHVHYSIDVFSAFFIAYGTFKIGEWLFKRVDHY